MKFIKPIPHQNSKSPRITSDYFDAEALKILEIGKLFKIDLYYPVVNAIKNNKTKIFWHEGVDTNVEELGIVGMFKSFGFNAEREHVPIQGQGWYKRLVIHLNAE